MVFIIDLTFAAIISFLSVLSGVIVFVTGQLVLKWLIEPIQEQRKIIGLVGYAIIMHAGVYSSPGIHKEGIAENVSNILRDLSAKLMSNTDVIPLYNQLSKRKIVIKKKDIEMACSELIGLSNSILMNEKGLARSNQEKRDKIQKLLRFC